MKEDITDVLNSWFDSKMDNVHTHLPGRILEYSGHKERKAKVQPLIKLRNSKNKIIEINPIENVPVIFPGSKNFKFLFPLNKGDDVLLLFSEANIGSFLNAINIQEADSPDRFGLQDCIAIPGLWSFPSVPTPPENDNDFWLIFNEGKINITKNNDIIIDTNKNINLKNIIANLKIEDTGLFEIKNQITSLKDKIDELWTAIDDIYTTSISWTSINAVPGSPVTPNPTTLALYTAGKIQAGINKGNVGNLLK